ncbi:MAG: GNAT family N-acetyltransferase [Thermoanaerobaculia bacterium]
MRADREIIRRATESDVPQLNALFRDVFHEERPESVWLWKFFRNPAGTFSYLCEAEGRVIAHCGGAPVRFHAYAEPVVALQSVDFMSSPSYAGGVGSGGVFVRMVRAFFSDYCGPDKIPVVFGFPGERHRLLGERILGYRPVERVVEFEIQPSDAPPEFEPLRTSQCRLFDQPVALGAVRDPAYLHWRYLDHPLFRYNIVRVRSRWSLQTSAAAIVRETDEKIYVMEITARDTAAVRNLVAKLARAGKPAIIWMSPENRLGQALRDSGVRCADRDHYVEVRFFRDRPMPARGEFYYTLGDYDVY